MSDRACLRCIAKKRRCDHVRPVCGSCERLETECRWPPPQARRGPVAGLSKRAETRVQQCEDALYYLLSLPDVRDAVTRSLEAGTQPLAPAPTASMDRVTRAEWWDSHPFRSTADVLAFSDECAAIASGTMAEPQQSHSAPVDTPEPTRHRLSDRANINAMGPSLWQLVSAAIPDDVDTEHEPRQHQSAAADSEQQQQHHDGPPTEAQENWNRLPSMQGVPPFTAQEQLAWSAYASSEDGKKRKRREDVYW